MSEASIALIITSFFTFAASVLAAWVANKSKQSADLALEAAKKADESAKKAVLVSTEGLAQTNEVAGRVDGRMSELLYIIKGEQKQAGHAQGVKDEQERVAEQLRVSKVVE